MSNDDFALYLGILSEKTSNFYNELVDDTDLKKNLKMSCFVMWLIIHISKEILLYLTKKICVELIFFVIKILNY